jgi:hypothetical protein
MSCHEFWEHGWTCIFDMHITDTDARSYWKKEFGKVLLQHKKEKKDKYLQTCLEMRKDFTPMVYWVDGIAGRKARNAKKRLATHLASKWNHGYSPDSVLCESLDVDCCCSRKQPPHPREQGSTATLAPSHPLWGCPWRLADLAGQLTPSPQTPSPGHSQQMCGLSNSQTTDLHHI